PLGGDGHRRRPRRRPGPRRRDGPARSADGDPAAREPLGRADGPRRNRLSADGIRTDPRAPRSLRRLPGPRRDALSARLPASRRVDARRSRGLGGVPPVLVLLHADDLEAGNGVERGSRRGRPLAGREPAPPRGRRRVADGFGAVLLDALHAIRDPFPRPAADRGLHAFRSWDENAGALPDIRLASSWREASGPVDALRTLPGLPAEEIVVETGAR